MTAASSVADTESFLDIVRAGVDDDHKPELVAHLFLLPSADLSQNVSVASSSDLIDKARLYFQQYSSRYVWHTGHPPSFSSSASSPDYSSSSPLLTLQLQTPVAAPDTDEWFALHLLITFATTLSASNSGQRFAIQATDSDGDFLLIQGADELPEWIEPSNASNRVWLLPSVTTEQDSSTGAPELYPLASLHLIGPELAALPPEHAGDDSITQQLSIAEALQILSKDAAACRAGPALQAAALEPMVEFSATDSRVTFSNVHTTLAYLPSPDLAALLQQHPQLGAQALGALEGLSADQVDRRVISRMDRFGHLLQQEGASANRKDRGLVLAPLSVTKALYALALHLVFFPPKPQFSQEWRDSVASFRVAEQDQETVHEAAAASQFDGPKIMEIDEAAERSRHKAQEQMTRARAEGRWRDIGAKIICGLELLYARGRSRLRGASTRIAGWQAKRSAPGEESDLSLDSVYSLENVPELIDSFIPLPASRVGLQKQGSHSERSNRTPPKIVDRSADLQILLGYESSTDWLSNLTDPSEGLDTERAGVRDQEDEEHGTNADDEAFSRLQNLMQGTTDFLNDESADYRGAIFEDENEGDTDEDEPEDEDGGDRQGSEEGQTRARNGVDSLSDSEEDVDEDEDGAGVHPGITDEADEMENFLAFAREELGIDDALWAKIQADRQKDGRYVPPPPLKGTQAGSSKGAGFDDGPDTLSPGINGNRRSDAKKVRFEGFAQGFLNKKPNGQAKGNVKPKTPIAEPPPQGKKRSSLWDVPDDGVEDTDMSFGAAPATKSGVQDDDGFYEMLDRMDAELAKTQRLAAQERAREAKAAGKQRANPSAEMGPDKAATVQDEDEEMDSDDDSDEELDLQDAELLQKLVSAQGEALLGRSSGAADSQGSHLDDLNAGMLANLLESIKAQGGAPGPVTNLAGRLGVGRLPRDDDDQH